MRTFLKKASEVNLTFSLRKCVFRGTQLRFLGHIVKNGSISPDPERSAPFRNFPIPSTIKELERFIGLAVYHSKWVPRFSHVMEPLFSALKLRSLPLSSDALQAINQVKKAIHEAVLFVPDPNKPLTLSTDASNTAVAAILSQNCRPVAFMSRRLSTAQKRWSPAELEGYAVVQACQQFRHFLTSRPFTVQCDQHGFVQALNSTSSRAVKNAKFARWRMELAEFDFSIQHIPGILNTAADALSRGVSTVSMDKEFQLVKSRHEQYGHPGIFRLGQLLRDSEDSSLVSNIEKVCHNVISNCRVCAEVKPRWINVQGNHVIKSTAPWQRISIDFMTNKPASLGYTNILTICDEFSRYPFAFATKDRSTETVTKCLKQLFTLCGPPESIHSDNGAEFLSDEFRFFLSSWGVHQSHTSPYNPAGNGQVERYNGVIWKTVQSIITDRQLSESSWSTVLGEALHCIRSLVNRVTNTTPHDRFFNFKRRICPSFSSFPLEAGKYAWLRRYVRQKNTATGSLVKIIAAYPGYAVVSRDEGQSTNIVNWRHLAPHPGPSSMSTQQSPKISYNEATEHTSEPTTVSLSSPEDKSSVNNGDQVFSRAGRLIKAPVRFGFEKEENVG